MNFRDLALNLDAQIRPVEAAWAYEVAITEPNADVELFLNLAVLYFQCADLGYAAHHHLSEEFVSGAWDRAFEILEKAEERFGSHTELEFWRLYFPFIYSGDEPITDACEELASRNDSLVPYLYLFTASARKQHLEEAQELLKIVSDGATERKRYIRSVLGSV